MKTIIASLLLVAFATTSFAQKDNKKEQKEKMKAEKIAYISQELELTPEEAEVFWPLYNEYKEKRRESHQKVKAIHKELRDNGANLSDADKEKMADDMIDLRLSEAQLDKAYHAKFKAILPIDKVLKLYKAEVDFRKKMMKEYGKRGGKPHGQNQGQPQP